MGKLDVLTKSGGWKRAELDRLGRWLLPEKILGLLPRDKTLVIAPHRQLNYLPWSALTAGDVPLVGRSYPVIVPSIQSLAALMERPAKVTDWGNGLLLAVSKFEGRHRPLPFVQREIQSLQQIIPECLSLMDENATWPAFQVLAKERGLDDFSFLHAASHAFADTLSGRMSGLALYDRDVWLDELRECGPFPELITLSACSGSKSRFFEGDEQIGLATTFLAAGARQVVASLWPIKDDEAANLMTIFYEYLTAGYAVGSALSLTMRSYISEGKEVSHWAGFRCTGLPN
jgi:CHAT domain-containing protein